MVTIKLTVILDIEGLELAALPEGFEGKIEAYKGQPLSPAEGWSLLFITGNPELVKQELCDRRWIVFVGDPSQIDPEMTEDIWPAAEDKELLRWRLKKLFRDLRNRFEAKFYRQTLYTTIDTVPDMLWYKRLDGIHTMVNEAFTEVVHKEREDILGKDHFYIWDAPRPAEGNEFACAESEEIAISTGRMYVCDEPVKTREGMKQLTTYKTPVYDPFGNVFGTVGVGHDVTNFSNLGIELSILTENLPYPMTIFTPEWKVVQMNSNFQDIIGGEDPETFDFQQWLNTVPVPVGDPIEEQSKHSVTREYEITAFGELRNYLLTTLEIRDFFDNVSGYFCTMRDITYERAYQQSILKTANTDMLTGMNNRRYIYQYLSDETKPYHFLYLDLDRFKAVNDRHGHNIGDEVLIKTARLIEECFPGTVHGRLGGDEFAVIDAEHSREELERCCGTFRKAVEDAFQEYGCGTTVSIGIAFHDGSGKDIDDLIYRSDSAMYEEKLRHHGEGASGV